MAAGHNRRGRGREGARASRDLPMRRNSRINPLE
jgi:hypothetical protein